MMTMQPWLARPLRRFVGTAAMAVGGQAFIHGLLFPAPALPPADVDRAVVVQANGSRDELRDPAAVHRIVAFVRAPREEAGMHLPNGRLHKPVDARTTTFYREGQVEGRMFSNARILILPAGPHQDVWYFLTPAEGAELQRLMGESTR
jgi:hypothetical protein